MSRPAVLVAIATIVLSACSAGPAPSASGAIPVVATTTVLADLVARIGGPDVSVTSLVPRNADVHTYEPRPSDLRAVADARLLVMNGLGLDDWLSRTVANVASPEVRIVRLGETIPVDQRIGGSADEGETWNPHLWLAIPYAVDYVETIAAALSGLDPTHAPAFAARLTDYRAALEGLDADARARFAAIPASRRRIVTFHDALPYFARAYGLTIVGVAVPAPGQEPSPARIADLVAAIKAAGVSAVFSEAQFPTQVVAQIAAATGATVEASIYTDALGDPPIDSYLGLLRWDIDHVAGALGG